MHRAAIAALVLSFAAPASAQLGQVPNTPPPEGVAEGQGAGNPKGNYSSLNALPDWGGAWFGQFRADIVPGAAPKLKGIYAERYEAYRKDVIANDGLVKRERSNCSPPGMPIIMQTFQYPFEFIFSPGRVTINQEAWMQTRTIWTDGRAHEVDPDPTYMGDSIGRWEGDVLVVETIGINDALELQRGMTRSPKLVVHERIYLDPADPNLLVNDMVLDDPDALEEPFKVTARYGRDRYGKLIEFQCSENDRNPIDSEGTTLSL